MKLREYKGYVIGRDDLGRMYIHNTASPYSEDCDHRFIWENTIKAAKEEINFSIEQDRQMDWEE